MDSRKRDFLVGLTKLTRDTGICIGGCGCCGSPFLMEAEVTSSESGYTADNHGEIVMWIDPSDEYEWKTYCNGIIKP